MLPDIDEAVARAVEMALREDLGPDGRTGDITTEAVIGDETGSAVITSNQACVVAGLSAAAAVFASVGGDLRFDPEAADGEKVAEARVVVRLNGKLKAILKGERVALNFLSHLSGIATLTDRFVAAVDGTGADIYDTRKTTPGLRALEKYAVRVGGGRNHRFGLFDGVLIKDNHLAKQSIKQAIVSAKAASLPIEVEVETLEQLDEAIAAGADIVLLDNMSVDMVRQAVESAKGEVVIEVSGGVTLSTVREIAMAGAERISVGAITQGAPAIDFSLTVF
ncbi:MAG: carboxylating nicotinate-nucleotide diphosphorylase [Actinomycetota bacterium]|nr:carboxylating nicotinate-nucleotide diphosphorylase [Actinomycetota bacterium]